MWQQFSSTLLIGGAGGWWELTHLLGEEALVLLKRDMRRRTVWMLNPW
jgi:hypothetical protein